MGSKYQDNTALVQVIGNVFNDPTILEAEDAYPISEDDFCDDFHKIVFGSIYNLFLSGVKKPSIATVNDYLESRPKKKAIFDANKGNEYLMRVSEVASRSTFDYYFNRMKKMTLLRAYDEIGLDVSDLYDPDNLFDLKKKELQEEWLDKTDIAGIADKIDSKIEGIRATFTNTSEFAQSFKAGDGIEELIKRFEEAPDVGAPLYGNFINTITRGARLGKFFLRSAATGVGKTRGMIADACYIACNMIYDEQLGWIGNGMALPTVFVATEQDKDEVQTMMLAFIANVNEEHILNGRYEGDERDRVFKAAYILRDSPLYIEVLPDFSLTDVENVIKKNIREHNVQYVFYDYIHSSLKILAEISKQTGKMPLREDNVLFMLSARLKDICVKYNIFMESATQLNGQYTDSETPDQNLLRGAKAIADKIDYGAILLGVTDKDLASLEKVLSYSPSFSTPNIKLSIYKNRRGRWKSVYLWCKADLGTCRIQPMFMTDYRYELQSIENVKVVMQDEPGAF